MSTEGAWWLSNFMSRDQLFVLLCLLLSLGAVSCSRDSRPVSRKVLVYSWKNAFLDDVGARCLGVSVAEITDAEVLKAYDILPQPNELKPVGGPPEPIPNSPWLVVIDPVATPKAAWLIHADGRTFWRYDSAAGFSNKLVLGAPSVQVMNDEFTKKLAVRLAKIDKNFLSLTNSCLPEILLQKSNERARWCMKSYRAEYS